MKEANWYDLESVKRHLKMNLDGADSVSLEKRVQWAIDLIEEILEKEDE